MDLSMLSSMRMYVGESLSECMQTGCSLENGFRILVL